MEEKQEKKQEPEFKGKMGIVWLVGILVIILGCLTVYTIKLASDNKKQNQAPTPAQQPQTVATQEQAKTQTTAKEEKTEETKTTSTQEKTTYSYSELEGVYEGTDTIKLEGKNVAQPQHLELYKDGTYKFVKTDELAGVPYGTIGNYVIDGDKIILNSWFETGSDISIGVKNEKETLTVTKNTIGKMKKTNKNFEEPNAMQVLRTGVAEKGAYVSDQK